MSSSTSSSEPLHDGRQVFLKILLSIVLGMTAALAMMRGFAMLNDAGSQSMLGRVLEAQAAIPKIAKEENDLVLFFGSSMVEAGFSPREFDRDLAQMGVNTTSFNFGFGGLNPIFQDYVSRRIADEFKARNRRLKLALIEFNPFQTTQTRRQGAVALEESYIALLASPRELLDIVFEDPTRGIRMLMIRYLRDGVSAEMITTFFWAMPFQGGDGGGGDPDIERDETLEDRRNEILVELNRLFAEEYPDYDGSDWYYPWRGGGTNKSERSEETLALVNEFYEVSQTEFRMTEDLQHRINSADIEDLNFDPELVEAFIAIVQNFKEISDHVEVVLLPKNTEWIKNPPEALARQAAVLERIQQATGVKIRDHQVIAPVDNSMFSDTTHLNRYQGAVAYTRFLAEQYVDLLREPGT